ncbi:NAD+ kinase [Nematocida major]|uniref:NAD+ kinase n=1 Tax=Nematocida major TaxID=1912982 RepID=UPI0020089A32|nr:NAD+ kinase [Nematocida major]KAH9385246.1 NAD+ kinase [Nematocida major]
MKCLIVVKNVLFVNEYENHIKSIVEEYADVEVADIVGMYSNQEKYSEDYSAIITLAGDGTILKVLSICTDKGAGFASADYIEQAEQKRFPMYAKKCRKPKKGVQTDTVLPLLFAFDNSTKGRLCNIKKPLYEQAERLLSRLLEAHTRKDTEALRLLYAENAIRRRRLSVNGLVDALNEVYIYPREKGLLGGLTVSINGGAVYQNFRCDGVIISTATGSSGYNASAGGPILYGSVHGITMTFVCASDKKVSPVVLSSSCTVSIANALDGKNVHAVVDGCLFLENAVFVVKTQKQGAVYFADLGNKKYFADFLSAIQE